MSDQYEPDGLDKTPEMTLDAARRTLAQNPGKYDACFVLLTNGEDFGSLAHRTSGLTFLQLIGLLEIMKHEFTRMLWERMGQENEE